MNADDAGDTTTALVEAVAMMWPALFGIMVGAYVVLRLTKKERF